MIEEKWTSDCIKTFQSRLLHIENFIFCTFVLDRADQLPRPYLLSYAPPIRSERCITETRKPWLNASLFLAKVYCTVSLRQCIQTGTVLGLHDMLLQIQQELTKTHTKYMSRSQNCYIPVQLWWCLNKKKNTHKNKQTKNTLKYMPLTFSPQNKIETKNMLDTFPSSNFDNYWILTLCQPHRAISEWPWTQTSITKGICASSFPCISQS